MKKHLATALIVILFLLRLTYFAFQPTPDLCEVVPDDCFYFLKTAKNIVNGNGSTFDEINRTNGYQPLWMVVCIGAEYVFGSNLEASFRAILIFQTFLMLGTLLLASDTIKRVFGWKAAAFAMALMFYSRFTYLMINGMESSLFIFLLMFLFWYFEKYKILSSKFDFKKDLFAGVLIALIFLGRLDVIFLVLILFAHYLIRLAKSDNKADVFKKGSTTFITALVLVAPYLLWNLLSFGHLMPVSGASKNTFPALTYNTWPFKMFPEYPIIACAALIYLAGLIFVNIVEDKQNDEYDKRSQYFILLGLMSFGYLLHHLNTYLFMRWAVFNWHFASGIPLVIFGGAFFFNIIERFYTRKNSTQMSTVGMVLLVLVLSGTLFTTYKTLKKKRREFRYNSYIFAETLKENTKPDEVLAMLDCGVLAYFSERKIICLDGIINSFEYIEVLKNKKVKEYFKDKNLNYLISHPIIKQDVVSGNYEKFKFEVGQMVVMEPENRIWCAHEDEVLRSNVYKHFAHGENKDSCFIVWKYPGKLIDED